MKERRYDLRWWTKKTPHDAIKRRVDSIRRDQSYRRERLKRLAEAYGEDMTPIGWSPVYDEERLQFNAMRNALETFQSKMAQNEPLPMFMTDGGSYSERKRAREKSRFVEGVFQAIRMRELAQYMAIDMSVAGLGCLYFYAYYGRVAADRVMPCDVFIDEAEARGKSPPCYYIRRAYPRTQVAEMYPAFLEKVESAEAADDDFFINQKKTDSIFVYDAWHMPSTPEAKDGLYVRCIDGATLERRRYTRDRPPLVFFRTTKSMFGFWGASKAREALPAQREYDFVNERLQRSMRTQTSVNLVVQEGAVNLEELSNEEGTLVRYTGNAPPQIMSSPGVDPQFYQYARDLPDWMLRHLGISQLSASSVKPPGITSGVALNALQDNESLRFMSAEKSWEQSHIDAGNVIVDIATEISDEDGEYSVEYNDGTSIRRVRWSDVHSDNDPISTRVYAVSGLSKHPAARQQTLSEWFNAGIIDLSDYKRLSGLPDLESESELDTADVDIVDMLIDKMLLTGKPYLPEPTDDFDIIVKRGTKAVNLAREREHDERKIDVVRQYVNAAIEMKRQIVGAAQQAASAQQQAMPPPGAPAPMQAAPPPGPGGVQ